MYSADYIKQFEQEQCPCVLCKDKEVCEARQDTESWIYSEQVAHCFDLCKPDYHDVDYWVLLACSESLVPVSEEEEQAEE